MQKMKLVNFRNHPELELEFKEGVNGIIGKNGSGKSSVLEAIEFLCTGKLFDSKEQCITDGGSTGYVYGEFLIDDKLAKIKRALSESKTSLEYDGKKYSKSSDVKNLWGQLFQIDEHIFSNVIVAHQKDIPMLFSGEDRIREAIFQKIFLVPNTAKLRSLIWDEYLKKAPAEYYVDTPDVVLTKENQLSQLGQQRQIAAVSLEAAKKKTLLPEEKQKLLDDLVRYRQMEKNLLEVPQLEQGLANAQEQLRLLQSEQAGLATQIQGLDAGLFHKKRASLNELKTAFSTRNNYLNRISELKSLLNNFKFDQKEYDETLRLCDEYAGLIAGLVHKRDDLRKSLTTLEEAQKQNKVAKCPTCQQGISDFTSLVSKLKGDLTVADQAHFEYTQKLVGMADKKKSLLKSKEQIDQLTTQLDQIESMAKTTKEVQFDENLLTILKEAEDKFLADKQRHDELTNSIGGMQLKQKMLEEQLASKKNVEPDFATQLARINSFLQMNEQAEKDYNDCRMALGLLDQQIVTLKNSIEENKLHAAENAKRAIYVNTLQKLYEIFHISVFPRKLAQTYVAEVERQLTRFLVKFNFRYRAKVLDNFKIQMINDSGYTLPRVSGGQEMVVGLCLRMALHAMFSQAFPMLIIDEGTTHLDSDENRPLYFEIIKGLRQELGIKQLIVIDHDAGLAGVCDHAIQL